MIVIAVWRARAKAIRRRSSNGSFKFPERISELEHEVLLQHLCDAVRNGESSKYHVIASLPWSLLGTTLQKKMLRTISGIMSPDTQFVTYGYIQARILPSGIKFERLLHQFFKKVKISKLVWRNVPPAVVYYCEDPKVPQELK